MSNVTKTNNARNAKSHNAKVVDDAKAATTNEAMTIAQYCKAHGLNAKVVRARLRKAGASKVNGSWVLNDATQAFTTGKRDAKAS